MRAAIERLAVANTMSQVLAIDPSQPDAINVASSLGLPDFLLSENLWTWAASRYPGMSWMKILKELVASSRGGITPDHPVAEAVKALFPASAHLVAPAISLARDNPGALKAEVEKFLGDPEVIKSAVVKAVEPPERLIRCERCLFPFYTDGVKRCPFCE